MCGGCRRPGRAGGADCFGAAGPQGAAPREGASVMRVHRRTAWRPAGLGSPHSAARTPALRTLLIVGAAAALGVLSVPANVSAASGNGAGSGVIAGAAR